MNAKPKETAAAATGEPPVTQEDYPRVYGTAKPPAPPDFTILTGPFPPEEVKWRVGSTTQDKSKGLALAYIDARAVMNRLDQVVSPQNWQDEYQTEGARVICRLSIKIGDEWITKSDGAGATATEGEKGAISDAFKRAAVKWGIGRYLYGMESPWVQIVPAGKSFRIADSERARLAHVAGGGNGTVQTAQAPPSQETNADPHPISNPDGPMSDGQRKFIWDLIAQKKITEDEMREILRVETGDATKPEQIKKGEAPAIIEVLKAWGM